MPSILSGLRARVLLLICTAVLLCSQPAYAGHLIRLQLKYAHSFQFAGFYMAKNLGFYAEEGLDVQFTEGTPGRAPVSQLIRQKADYAIADTDALLAFAEGKDVVVLAALFQTSPEVLAIGPHVELNTPADLRGKKIMTLPRASAPVMALLHKYGVTSQTAQFLPYNTAIDSLLSEKIDAAVTYDSWALPYLAAKGKHLDILSPKDYGIDFYGDCILSSRKEVTMHPDEARAFLRATYRGWDYAMAHPLEAAQYIHAHFTPNISVEQLLGQERILRSAMMPELISFGSMNRTRWEKIYSTYVRLGFLDKDTPVRLDRFIFTPEQSIITALNKTYLRISCFVAGAVGLILIALLLFNYKLKRAVEDRTEELRTSQHMLETILSVSPFAFLITKGHKIEWANEAISGMLGYSPAELMGMNTSKLYWNPKDCDEIRFSIESSINQHDTEARDLCFRHKDGSLVHVYIAVRLFDPKHPGLGYIIAVVDITSRKAAEESNRLAAQVYQQSNDSIIITDRENRIISANPRFTELTGIPEEEALGQKPCILKSGRHDAAFYSAMWDEIHKNGRWSGEIWNRRKDGEIFPAWLSISSLKDPAGHTVSYTGVLTDLTSEKRSERQISKLNNYDVLTELPNRTLFQNLLKQEIQTAQLSDKQVAVLLFDLDNFKTINDSLGIAAGDEFLQTASRRVSQGFSGKHTVARLGSDEFAILLPYDPQKRNITKHITRLQNLLAPVTRLGSAEVFMSACIGVSIYPDDATGPSQLMQNAENALHHARKKGPNSYSFFSAKMTSIASDRIQLEAALHRALKEQEFRLFFQPKVHGQTGQIMGAEALLRWEDPKRGIISPGAFMNIIEEGNLIHPVGSWVLRQGCQACRRMHEAGFPNFIMAVNISPRQFLERDIVDIVRSSLEKAQLAPKYLELEITEALLIQNTEDVEQTLRQLRELGVRIALDDFGTGYSSLSYLTEFPIDTLKIDQSFIRTMCGDTKKETITRTIQHMALELGLTVVAEGVETQEQFATLREQGPVLIQGYLFSPPQPENTFLEWTRDYMSQQDKK
ncbi:EAL domain-containing protein [Desulfobaculum bizertense]|uniref:EAL domain-containing protein n=1 Tax=Desulfobaculum bizertense TaxID=376490 RepID=UPI001F20F192|nr:EAL domain-containing protein [Desulfobaculum bizertense]UIJ36787.1 EAL domain-containing protein [Desulfobaculum bizertense]